MLFSTRPQSLWAFFLQAGLLGAMLFFFSCFLRTETPQNLRLPLIVNVHEHIESAEAAQKYLDAAERQQISLTVILGSPKATLVPGLQGFQGEDPNNRSLLKLAHENPDRFIVFPTLNPEDPRKLERLEEYVRLGAKGLKLYSGHGIYHRLPLDEASMLPVYAYCQRKQLPVMLHVNPALYQEEFENVLRAFPDLKVICPHYCLSTLRTDRFRRLMDRYPNLYTDTSFGYIGFFKEALLRFSKDPQTYRALILRYQDRILFGTDLVVTDESYKTAHWLEQMIRGYRSLLEKETFSFFDLPGRTLNGLRLDRKVLKKIYSRNFERLMGGRWAG